MKRLIAWVVAITTLGAGALVQAARSAPNTQHPAPSTRGTPSTRSITIEQLVDIRHPSNPAWSADGRQVTFTWERAGVATRYVSDLDGRPPRLLPDAPAPGGRGRGGTAARSDLDGVASPDGARIAFVRGSELWVRGAGGHETRLASEQQRIGAVSWSPDGAYVLFTAAGAPIRHEQTPAYSGSKIIYTITENVPGQAYAIPVAGGDAVKLPAGGFGARRWLDARHFIFERTSPDFKRRTIYIATVTGGEPRVLFEDLEPKFWSMTGDAGGNAQPSPDGKWIAFLSDRDGWDHLYVTQASGGEAVQITKGKFEAWRPQWSSDSTRIAFDANEPDRYGDRHLHVATINGNPHAATIAQITTGRGTDIAPLCINTPMPTTRQTCT